MCKSQNALNLHQRSEHLRLEFRCPVEGCPKTLTSKLGIKEHVKFLHEAIIYPCHVEGCAKILSSSSTLARHVKEMHSSVRIPCPHPGCKSVSRSEARLTGHMKQAHDHAPPLIHVCPMADREGCSERFPDSHAAAMHANVAHYGKFPCVLHEESGCTQLFADKAAATCHAYKHRSWICPIPQCVDNVMGRGKCRDTYLEHEKQHEELGHFTTLTDVPKPKEFIVRTEFADADAEATTTTAESDESLDEDYITSDFQADDSPGKSHFH